MVHDIAGLLKLYFRELPEPLVTNAMHAEFIQAARIQDDGHRVEALKHLVQRLPPTNAETFKVGLWREEWGRRGDADKLCGPRDRLSHPIPLADLLRLAPHGPLAKNIRAQ